MQITIPFKTPSINHLYFNFRNIRILTKKAREIKKEIQALIDALPLADELQTLSGMPLKVSCDIYESWYLIDGETIARKDIGNREKFLIDAVFDALKIDDKFIFENTMRKIDDDEEKAIITIEAIC